MGEYAFEDKNKITKLQKNKNKNKISKRAWQTLCGRWQSQDSMESETFQNDFSNSDKIIHLIQREEIYFIFRLFRGSAIEKSSRNKKKLKTGTLQEVPVFN